MTFELVDIADGRVVFEHESERVVTAIALRPYMLARGHYVRPSYGSETDANPSLHERLIAWLVDGGAALEERARGAPRRQPSDPTMHAARFSD